MNEQKLCVFDIEGNDLNADKIWVMSAAIYSNGKWRLKSTHDYDEMRSFFLSCDILVGHNIIRWDIPTIERILDIKIEAKFYDTLGLSWYLEPYKHVHGLDDWGQHFGIPKPKIKEGEWKGALPHETQEEFLAKMRHRCEEDVKINCKLWEKQLKDLYNLYDGKEEDVKRLINYLMFKLDCAREAEQSKWKLDVDRATKVYEYLLDQKETKEAQLKEAMPKVPIMKTKKKPKVFTKQDGSLSAAGVKWIDLLESLGLPETHEEPVTYQDGHKEPNPSSHVQIKNWLYELGWIPETFKYKSEVNPETGRWHKVKQPQVRDEIRGEKVLCNSVKALYEKEPALEIMEGLSVINHRIGIFKGYLKNMDEDGFLEARVSGFTNTLRFKHSVIVNLPNVKKPFGMDVRGCLIARDGYELVGSDMSSLEDRTKQHFMWDFDPDYVREMMTDDFDPHLDLAVVAGFLTQEQVESHKRYDKYKNLWSKAVEANELEEACRLKPLWECEESFGLERSMAKTANYACVYGAVGATVARGSGGQMTVKEGEELVEKYWERNWAVKAVADAQKTKRCFDTMWLWNPISKLWYSLRYEKDIFSTLNQGSGVYCFDTWIKHFRKVRPQLTGQMHDEVILEIKKGHREEAEKLLRDAMAKTNEELKLNRELDIDVQFGDTYADIH